MCGSAELNFRRTLLWGFFNYWLTCMSWWESQPLNYDQGRGKRPQNLGMSAEPKETAIRNTIVHFDCDEASFLPCRAPPPGTTPPYSEQEWSLGTDSSDGITKRVHPGEAEALVLPAGLP